MIKTQTYRWICWRSSNFQFWTNEFRTFWPRIWLHTRVCTEIEDENVQYRGHDRKVLLVLKDNIEKKSVIFRLISSKEPNIPTNRSLGLYSRPCPETNFFRSNSERFLESKRLRFGIVFPKTVCSTIHYVVKNTFVHPAGNWKCYKFSIFIIVSILKSNNLQHATTMKITDFSVLLQLMNIVSKNVYWIYTSL